MSRSTKTPNPNAESGNLADWKTRTMGDTSESTNHHLSSEQPSVSKSENESDDDSSCSVQNDDVEEYVSGEVFAVPHEAKWDIMFNRLLSYKAENGNCLVPNRYKLDRKLGSWVSTQRRQYKASREGGSKSTTLSQERIDKLDSIAFVWNTSDPRRVAWNVRYLELCQFRRIHGHTLVSARFKENVLLANWVGVQRQEYKKLRQGKSTKLTSKRIKLLERVDFVWEAAPRGARRKIEEHQPVSLPFVPRCKSRVSMEDIITDACSQRTSDDSMLHHLSLSRHYTADMTSRIVVPCDSTLPPTGSSNHDRERLLTARESLYFTRPDLAYLELLGGQLPFSYRSPALCVAGSASQISRESLHVMRPDLAGLKLLGGGQLPFSRSSPALLDDGSVISQPSNALLSPDRFQLFADSTHQILSHGSRVAHAASSAYDPITISRAAQIEQMLKTGIPMKMASSLINDNT